MQWAVRCGSGERTESDARQRYSKTWKVFNGYVDSDQLIFYLNNISCYSDEAKKIGQLII